MTMKNMLLDGALKLIARFHPGIGPVVTFAIDHEDDIDRLMPVITAAVEEGGSAYEAATKAAPKLAGAIRDFIHAVPASAPSHTAAAKAVAVHTENATREVFGLPHLTDDQEKDWMDRATPPDDSRVGSG